MTSHYPTCEICAPLQGRVYSITGKDKRFPPLSRAFQNGYHNVHPNCFVSGTPVLAKGVMAHSSRNYVGKIVTIEISDGNKLAVTPNHPILTPKGWVAAGALLKGDKVVKYSRIDDFFVGEHPNDINIPTFIEDVPCAFGKALGVSTHTVETTPEQFHGDGTDGEIAIINIYGLLWNKGKSFLREKLAKLLFVFRFKFCMLFNAFGAFAQIFERTFRAPDGDMRGGGQGLALFRGHSGKACAHSFGTVGSSGNSSVRKPALDCSFVDAVMRSDSFFGLPRVIPRDDFIGGDVDVVPATFRAGNRAEPFEPNSSFSGSDVDGGFPDAEDGRDLLNRLSGKVEFLDVVHVDVDLFHGKVYNLQTESGWYLANNIITHNCRHSIHAYIESLHTPEELRQAVEQSNAPFEDTRPEAERALYDRQQSENRQARQDLYQYERYKARLGDEAPKSFSAFRRMKKAGGESWEALQKNYSGWLYRQDYSDIMGMKGKLNNYQVRRWYKTHDEGILGLIDKSLPLERQAHTLRNQYRTQARELMSDQETRRMLDEQQPNPTFEQTLKHKELKYGLTGDAAYRDIIRSSGTTSKKFDRESGIDDGGDAD